MSIEASAMSVVVQPSAREMFTPRGLAAAYEHFTEREAQYLRPSENTAFPAILPLVNLKRAYW